MVSKDRLRRLGGTLGETLAGILESLPALMLAWLVLRAAEGIHAAGAGVPQSTLFGAGVGNDAMSLLRYGFVFLLAGLPLAFIRSQRIRTVLLGLAWSLLLCLQAGLVQYHWVAGVPLGADLFAYSGSEIGTTVAGGWTASPLLLAALPLSLAVLWAVLAATTREWWPRFSARSGALALAISLAAFALLPDRFLPRVVRTDADLGFVINKTAYFADSSLGLLRGGPATAQAQAAAQGDAPWDGKDPRYPFLRAERTPDTLGPLFKAGAGAPPNLVFIIVEGLGRSFSGPGARLGSFTPFLDELAQQGLYFENFLAGQGRTFGVLTTVFGSLPFGEQGLAALGERMPRHDSLLTVLRAQGYRLKFYSGSNMEFDNEGLFLRAQGVDSIVSEKDFGPGYRRSNDWGYADRDLVEMALERERKDAHPGPALSIIQTTSMHSPFTFPGQDAWRRRVPERLVALGRAPQPVHEDYRDIFASILYTDDALRLFFEQARTLPGYENTIFVITGDHRLPELPMDTRIERYHVPLIVVSPLLKAPRAIKAVSSQFDIAPSLLAYLANNHGLKSPARVTWLGTGLDVEPAFRNLHAIPLKQTKTEMSDFVSGSVYLAQGQLHTLADGMSVDRAQDAGALAKAQAQFGAFLRANAQAGKAAALSPPGTPLAAYGEVGGRTLRSVPLVSEAGEVGVSGVRPRPGTGRLAVEATFTNHAAIRSREFAPLLVITNEHGLELGEVTGEAMSLAPGKSATVTLHPDLGKIPSGTYYLSVLPSHPDTGRSIGVGQYHVELKL
ncbi:LTA synthase family protein [Massilia sp. ST3]|uniref:LTA synthase family protein n=1 Tax=Massilia sp. ST3 TaxID=2824903 RepID=UPI001B82D9FD|nr:LTA synthase family protein [Massilia sp. ST3]MBQ5949732.1 LTA synthase family protein [Massilia sp. ST3]